MIDTDKNALYEKYKYIVDVLLHKYQGMAIKSGIELSELEQEGYLALSNAINSYDQNKNTSFSTFITLCVDRRLKKIIKRYMGEKAQAFKNIYSLDYNFNQEGVTLQDLVSDDLEFEPLNNLTLKENYQELVAKIKKSLSEMEYEVFLYVINELDYQTIAILMNKNPKQIDNTIQRIKLKIRDIIKE